MVLTRHSFRGLLLKIRVQCNTIGVQDWGFEKLSLKTFTIYDTLTRGLFKRVVDYEQYKFVFKL